VLPSTAEQVTFFEDRAEVVRTVKVSLVSGAQWVRIGGLSLFTDDSSLQAKVTRGAARILAARVSRRAHLEKALGREEIDALEQKARAARRRMEAADREIDRAQRSEWRVTELVSKWAAAIAEVPRAAGDQGKPAPIEAWGAALDTLDQAALSALDAGARAREQKAAADDERTQAERRLQEGKLERPRFDALAEVQIEAEEPQEAELSLTYRLPNALWRPEHLARLKTWSDESKPAAAEIITWAAAWQITGEVWEQVDARFSTARPARAASPPAVTDEVLALRRKTDDERKRVAVAAREEAIAVAGLDRGTRAVDEMPGMDDGGEPLMFSAREKITLRSDGRPTRIEVAKTTLVAQVERVIYPEVAPVGHLRATCTLDKGGPLLAGPMRVARGQSLVGRSRIDYVGKGEPFEVGFGVDDSVRVRRTQDEERTTATLTGAQKLARTVKIFLTNLSGDPKRALVTERVPVSEIEDVEVVLTEAGGWTHSQADGLVRMAVLLGPRETKTVTIAYEIRAAARVQLPF
jgi:uncharacterized protein (TIGR02231 family)